MSMEDVVMGLGFTKKPAVCLQEAVGEVNYNARDAAFRMLRSRNSGGMEIEPATATPPNRSTASEVNIVIGMCW